MDLPRQNASDTQPAYSSAGTPGYFKEEAPATTLTAQWLNHVLRELLSLLEGLGGQPDPLNDHQIAPLLLSRCAGATPVVHEPVEEEDHWSDTIDEDTWISATKWSSAISGSAWLYVTAEGKIPLSICVLGALAYARLEGVYYHDDKWKCKISVANPTRPTVIIVWGREP